MKREITNEELLHELLTSIAELRDEMRTGFAHVDKQFQRVDEQFHELATMIKVQFDEVDRKFSVLNLRTGGCRHWI